MSSRDDGREPVLVVFKAEDSNFGLVWRPKFEEQLSLNTLGEYQLQQWLLYDSYSERILGPLNVKPPFDCELFHSRAENFTFLEVRVPLVYFSSKHHEDVVAYAPGFGRIGSFYKQQNLLKDRLYYGRILFMEFFKDQEFQLLMFSLNVDWAVKDLECLMTETEIKQFAKLHNSKLFSIVKGVIVGKEGCAHNTDTGQSVKRIYLFTKEKGLCECRVTADDDDETYDIGKWCSFVPVENYDLTMTAVSLFPFAEPKGIKIIESAPKLKLELSSDQYHMDQDMFRSTIHVFLLCEIESERHFVKELRVALQKRMQPKLIIEFDKDSSTWIPVDFSGRRTSPIPSRKNSEDANYYREERKFHASMSRLTQSSSTGSFNSQYGRRNSVSNRARGGARRPFSSSSRHPSSADGGDLTTSLVVSMTPSRDFYIYTPCCGEEMLIQRRYAKEGVEQGKWLLVQIKYENGRPAVVYHELDPNPPNWEVVPVRNTVQMKITAFVPLKLSKQDPCRRIVPTEWIEEVLDRQMRISKESEGENIKVLIERHKDPSGIPWHVKSVLQ